MLSSLGEARTDFFARLGAAGAKRGAGISLVGGGVRDLILGLGCADLDFAVTGDACTLAAELRSDWNGIFADLPVPEKIVAFAKYGTAKLVFGTKLFGEYGDLDFASTRSESYPVSGAAPVVKYPCPLIEDLARRDFSINAMALSLEEERFGVIEDPLRGEEDLAAKVLRVLHPRSFIDDPARLIRGVRFERRFSFSFDGETKKLFDEAARGRFLQQLPAVRRFDEFRKALTESKTREVVERLHEVGLLKDLLPAAVGSDDFRRLGMALSAGEDVTERWKRPLAALLAAAKPEEREKYLGSTGIAKTIRKEILLMADAY